MVVLHPEPSPLVLKDWLRVGKGELPRPEGLVARRNSTTDESFVDWFRALIAIEARSKA